MKRTRLRAVSSKRRARLEDRRAVVTEALDRDRQHCRLRDMIVGHRCGGPITPHELRKQSASAAGRYDVENIVALCAHGNTWVEDNPQLAHDLGLVIRDEDL